MGDDAAWSLLAYALIGGLVGAKACYVALHGPGALLSRAGMVWYGGLVGGALAVAWAIRRQHLPFRPSWQTSEEEADAPDGMWVFVRPAHFGAPKGRLSSRAG